MDLNIIHCSQTPAFTINNGGYNLAYIYILIAGEKIIRVSDHDDLTDVLDDYA